MEEILSTCSCRLDTIMKFLYILVTLCSITFVGLKWYVDRCILPLYPAMVKSSHGAVEVIFVLVMVVMKKCTDESGDHTIQLHWWQQMEKWFTWLHTMRFHLIISTFQSQHSMCQKWLWRCGGQLLGHGDTLEN